MKSKTLIIVAAAFSAGLPGATYLAAGTKGVREWKVPRPAAERQNPIPMNEQSLAAGRGVYSRECASCHGSLGNGDGKDGRDMDPPPASLIVPTVMDETDGALFWKISIGRKPMPSFKKDLTDEERWQVVHYVRTLAAKNSAEAKR